MEHHPDGGILFGFTIPRTDGVELGVEVVPDDAHHELFNKDYLNYDIFISMYNIHMYNILVCTIVVLFGHLAPPPMQPVPGYSITRLWRRRARHFFAILLDWSQPK